MTKGRGLGSGFGIKKIEYGGGFAELISMIFLYIFKLIGLEIPLKKVSDKLREAEYSAGSSGTKFATLFVRAEKIREHMRDRVLLAGGEL